MEFRLKYHLNASLIITGLQPPSSLYLQELAIGFPAPTTPVRQVWAAAWQERGSEGSWTAAPADAAAPAAPGAAGSAQATPGAGAGTAGWAARVWPELFCLWLPQQDPSLISFAAEVAERAPVWWGGAAWREENASTRSVIKPLITFNSLAIYIGLDIPAVGRNTLAKGKSKYDLNKARRGVKSLDRNCVSLYTFFNSRNYSFFQGCLSNLQVSSSSFIRFTMAKAYPGETILCYQECSLLCLSGKSRTGEVLPAECIRKSSVSLEVGNHSHLLKAALQLHRQNLEFNIPVLCVLAQCVNISPLMKGKKISPVHIEVNAKLITGP